MQKTLFDFLDENDDLNNTPKFKINQMLFIKINNEMHYSFIFLFSKNLQEENINATAKNAIKKIDEYSNV